ncbi:DUF3857 and transglutaminase domain-containing protein [Pelagicoccus sp. SDUM812003]|uniref:DUF3857 and transglutaminase domain-containing protein n=1 Tax=Pelagicoccus sp. SDUM812003 TaxID=3041267 RepID=UPI00280ED5BE|nr:DUF3857 and transglutaminase domain-containing protein [Pelagicoccus sp. SDUM812003]MDQ8203322.1 DUF3857 and transglutaminase domain-containing protein [Pelagicoccus sp. SDUM812003]
MKNPRSLYRVFAFLFLPLAANLLAYNWDDVPLEELASTECSFDPEAPAEVLFKEVIYDLDERKVRTIKTHLRTKIYEESALDQARRTKIWYADFFKASGINARVIKPDGSYIEIEKDDVVSQTEKKSNGRRTRSTTISIPKVEVGDIVEYRFRLILDEGYFLPKDEVAFQEAWPIRRLELKMKPYFPYSSGFKWASFRCERGMEKRGDFYEISMTNQPGYPEEPYQAPDSDARSWFLFYGVTTTKNGDDFWKSEGKRLFREMSSDTKVDKEVQALADELSEGKKSKEEMLRAFYDYCVSDLINSSYGEADRLTQDEREDLQDKWDAGKVIRKGYGTPNGINKVFCALAQAKGVDARIAACGDRSEYAFKRLVENVEVALPHTIVAIKNGDGWDFHNPASKYIPFGQLDWIHDGVTALIPDKKKLIFVTTPEASPTENRAWFEGDFDLSANGDLEGSLVLKANGNQALIFKQMLHGKSDADRVDTIEEVLKEGWSNCQIDGVSLSGMEAPADPVRIACRIKIPAYAESVGQRLFLQPNVEERYSESRFPSQTRKTELFFDFKYLDESSVVIRLPEGYELEAPSAPRPLVVESFYTYEPRLSLNRKSNELIYTRRFEFMGNRYDARAYPIIKSAFDDLLAQDHHTLTLKRSDELTQR